jgi:prephenate dehydrogenase
VFGVDRGEQRLASAIEAGAIDEAGELGECEMAFVATPVDSVAALAQAALDAGAAVVTDVGSVKGPVAAAVDDPRFVPGHPMAGSEQDGLAGAFADMFSGAMWVLCPTDTTDDAAYSQVRGVVSSFGAQVIVMPAERHDTLVAVVSHVPHLTAATLMRLADGRAEEHRSLLRLAAGGFRDMTRIAAGHPAIWPEICAQNQGAITDVLDELIRELATLREVVAEGQTENLLDHLESARHARRNLPTTAPVAEQMSEMRIPVLDRQGELAAIATLAADLDVNIYDLEIAHSAEGPRGVVVVLVESAMAERFQGGLMVQGYRPSIRPLD